MKIAFLGDICLTGKFDLESNPHAFQQFDQIRPKLTEYDFVLANLESPFTDQMSSRVCKAIHIKSPPVNTRLLQYLGVDAVSLANNHIFDYGRKGYELTLAALKAAGIDYFGTQGRTITLEKSNERLLLGGFCCLSAHPSEANSSGVNILNYSSFKHFLDAADQQRAFPVASVHWGDENIHYPSEDHVCFSRLMASESDFLLHGHHPHVIQGVESCNNSLIAYSLGNFCTDVHASQSIRGLKVRRSRENQQSYLLGVTLESGRILTHEIIPFEDTGDSLTVQGRAALDVITSYSMQLVKSYQRPRQVQAVSATDDPNMPDRFSLSWILRRLNYHFIGAYLKGLVNRIRYRGYFSVIRQKAADKGVC